MHAHNLGLAFVVFCPLFSSLDGQWMDGCEEMGLHLEGRQEK